MSSLSGPQPTHLPSLCGPQQFHHSLLPLLLGEGLARILTEVDLEEGVVHHWTAVRDVLRREGEGEGSGRRQRMEGKGRGGEREGKSGLLET